MNFIISQTIRNAPPLIFFTSFRIFFQTLQWLFFYVSLARSTYMYIKNFLFLLGTIYQRDLIDKLLLYIILVLMQICSIHVIQIMIFVEMDKRGIFSMVLRYCQALQKLITLFSLILLMNFDETLEKLFLVLLRCMTTQIQW